jgi:hypothetical protein
MFCTLIIVRYPKYTGIFGLISMALFRLPLYINKKIKFFKLLGSGKNGTFDIHPDLNQWGVLFTADDKHVQAPPFIYKYFNFFRCDVKEFLLQPVEGHGLWDKKKVFGELYQHTNNEGAIAVLTRATIRIKRLKNFWDNAEEVAGKMPFVTGLIISYGIGEVPWIKQATFSVWENKNVMKDFAYNLQQHKEVIHKTRSENWYKEEMFVRFHILSVKGFPESIATKLLTLQAAYEKA